MAKTREELIAQIEVLEDTIENKDALIRYWQSYVKEQPVDLDFRHPHGNTAPKRKKWRAAFTRSRG